MADPCGEHGGDGGPEFLLGLAADHFLGDGGSGLQFDGSRLRGGALEDVTVSDELSRIECPCVDEHPGEAFDLSSDPDADAEVNCFGLNSLSGRGEPFAYTMPRRSPALWLASCFLIARRTVAVGIEDCFATDRTTREWTEVVTRLTARARAILALSDPIAPMMFWKRESSSSARRIDMLRDISRFS